MRRRRSSAIVPDEEHRSLGAVLERHYRLIDEAIGRAIEALGPDDLLLVVSGFGMEPMGIGKRMLERAIGDRRSERHARRGAGRVSDGLRIASVAPGRLMTRASIVDMAPTILYVLGLPIGRDMDGYARTDLFQRAFTDANGRSRSFRAYEDNSVKSADCCKILSVYNRLAL